MQKWGGGKKIKKLWASYLEVKCNISGSAVMNRCMNWSRKADVPETPGPPETPVIVNLLKRIAVCAALTSVRSGRLVDHFLTFLLDPASICFRHFHSNSYSTQPEPSTGLQFGTTKKVDKISPPREDPVWWSDPNTRMYSPYRWRI